MSDEIRPLVLADGSTVDSHTDTVANEAMREPLRAAIVPGVTHVVTIRGGAKVRAGDVLEVGGERWTALAVYDPYENHGIPLPAIGIFKHLQEPMRSLLMEAEMARRVAAKQMLLKQRGKWLKILIGH